MASRLGPFFIMHMLTASAGGCAHTCGTYLPFYWFPNRAAGCRMPMCALPPPFWREAGGLYGETTNIIILSRTTNGQYVCQIMGVMTRHGAHCHCHAVTCFGVDHRCLWNQLCQLLSCQLSIAETSFIAWRLLLLLLLLLLCCGCSLA